MTHDLHTLFPTPGEPPSHLSPPHWPGVSPSSTETLLEVLKHNHEQWHTFINEKHYHNHAPHRSLALWSLGADGDVIRAGFEKDCGYEQPAMKPPGTITKENWVEHLGDERYYHAYVEFFEWSFQKDGINHTLEEYLFGASANVGKRSEGMLNAIPPPQPKMLGRFFSGVVHPLIHTGYGLEFGLPGMMAEGLAQTAVHPAAAAPLVPKYLFEESSFNAVNNFTHAAGKGLHDALSSTIQSIDAAFGTFLPNNKKDALRMESPDNMNNLKSDDSHPDNSECLEGKDVHALDILGWVSKDMRFIPNPDPTKRDSFDDMIGKHAETLLKFAHLWHLDSEKLGSDQGYLDGKIEELAFVVCVMFGVGGWTGRGRQEDGSEAPFNADFFLMHLVTSSVFIPSICAYISPTSRAQFLHTYLVVALALYVFRGCPALDIVGFQQDMKEPLPVGPQPNPSKGTLPSPNSAKAINPDPWLPILQTSMVHPDEHVSKSQRSLSNWAAHFGTRKFKPSPSSSSSSSELSDAEAAERSGLGMGWNKHSSSHGSIVLELEGAQYLDGTVFLKTAELIAARMGRVREGQDEKGGWDFAGFFNRAPRKAYL